jgi:hypothetical protein
MSAVYRRSFILGWLAALARASLGWAQPPKGKAERKRIDPDQLDRETRRALEHLNKHARFPIRNFGELVRALGGERATITVHGRPVRVAALRKHIPASVFPVADVHDLANKASRLRAHHPPGRARGKRMEVPRDVKLPRLKDLPKPRQPGYVVVRGK